MTVKEVIESENKLKNDDNECVIENVNLKLYKRKKRKFK